MSAIAAVVCWDQNPSFIEDGHRLMDGFSRFPSDDIRTWQAEGAFLGCHAQWITPESRHEVLPYYDSTSQLAITADAILDNRDDLYESLQIDYTKRKTITDSELILLAYKKWGEDSPKHLVGDFAYIIWDARSRRLFAARDFSGSRTLYYIQDSNRLAVSTTIEPLLTLEGMQRRLNELWMAEYLAITGMVDAVSTHMTPYEGVHQLAPSHALTCENGAVRLRQHTHIEDQPKLKLRRDDEYIELFRDVFQQAVDARLRTFRGVSAQLSGGLDSGAVVSFAAKTLNRQGKVLNTFTSVPMAQFEDFTSKSYMADETPFVLATVGGLEGVNPYFLQFEGKNAWNVMDDMLDTMEMPYKFFENSHWLGGMFEAAKEHGAGVLLNGGRGNISISWGNATDYYTLLMRSIRWVKLANELKAYSRNIGSGRFHELKWLFVHALPSWMNGFTKRGQSHSNRIISSSFAERTQVYPRLAKHGIDQSGWLSGNDPYQLRRSHFRELFHWNASNTLACKLSLRHGVWKRDPTNDLRVIRLCLSIPEHIYVSEGRDRALIRRACEGYLVDSVRLNQKVHGIQSLDWVARLSQQFTPWVADLDAMLDSPQVGDKLHWHTLQDAVQRVKERGATPQGSMDANYRVVMRSLIAERFMQQF